MRARDSRRQPRRRRLFDHLLMPPLHRAVALEQMHEMSVRVADDLHFDVPRAIDEPLDVQRAVAERRARPRSARARIDSSSACGVADDAHALAAATGRGLEHDGQARASARPRQSSATSCDAGVTPGTTGTPAADTVARAAVFDPICRMTPAGRPDEDQAGRFARIRERRVLGQEAVPGMDGVRARPSRGVDDVRDLQIALGGGGRPDGLSGVGFAHVRRAGVGLRIHRDRVRCPSRGRCG